VIAKADEGLSELQILHRSDPSNATVPALEFLIFQDWHFAVMPYYDECDVAPFLRTLECLEFAEQILEVSNAAGHEHQRC